jgi:hypothetical protein
MPIVLQNTSLDLCSGEAYEKLYSHGPFISSFVQENRLGGGSGEDPHLSVRAPYIQMI